jgi:hypothetical protein
MADDNFRSMSAPIRSKVPGIYILAPIVGRHKPTSVIEWAAIEGTQNLPETIK